MLTKLKETSSTTPLFRSKNRTQDRANAEHREHYRFRAGASFSHSLRSNNPMLHIPISWLLLLAVVLLLASGFCDTLDGILARNYQQATPFGGFFDSLLDRYADAAVYTGIIISGLCNLFAGLVALAGSLMVSYSRARAEAAGIKMESIGLAERPERIIILAFATIAAIFWLPALNIGVILLAVLSNFTVLQRGWHVYKSLKKRNKSEN